MRIWGHTILQPHMVDPRSMALLRILLGGYILYDILVSRLLILHPSFDLSYLRFWCSFYTSLPSETSILAPQDTPHTAPLHQLWFTRGSIYLQSCLFVSTAIFAILFSLGYQCHPRPLGMVPCLLWWNVVAMQNRCQGVCDGSDTFLRSILFWCMMMDCGRCWSLDGYLKSNVLMVSMEEEEENQEEGSMIPYSHSTSRYTHASLRKRSLSTSSHLTLIQSKSPSPNSTNSIIPMPMPIPIQSPTPHCSIATLGLTTQIVLMYSGTVARRFQGTMWLPPQFSAVYYALSHTFATPQFAANLLQAYPYRLGQPMTMMAMLIETMAPWGCWVCPYRKYRHVPAMVLVSLHFGLWIMMRLPNWQLLAMIVCVVWIPSEVWNHWNIGIDIDIDIDIDMDIDIDKNRNKSRKKDPIGHDFQVKRRGTNKSRHSKVNRILSSFFLFYMVRLGQVWINSLSKWNSTILHVVSCRILSNVVCFIHYSNPSFHSFIHSFIHVGI